MSLLKKRKGPEIVHKAIRRIFKIRQISQQQIVKSYSPTKNHPQTLMVQRLRRIPCGHPSSELYSEPSNITRPAITELRKTTLTNIVDHQKTCCKTKTVREETFQNVTKHNRGSIRNLGKLACYKIKARPDLIETSLKQTRNAQLTKSYRRPVQKPAASLI